LTSLFEHEPGVPFELILVDNGSDLATNTLLYSWEKRHPSVKLVKNPENFNFALGNNIGFSLSSGARVVFLNNDTEVSPEWLRALVQPLKNEHVKGVQPKLLYPDGTLQCIGIV